MTLAEAITIADNNRPNGYDRVEKIRWLSTLDGMIKKQIIDTHEGSENCTFVEYDRDSDGDTVLLVPAPYDEIYIYYLESKIDYASNEISRYNNSNAMFNAAFSDFQRAYNRENRPIRSNSVYAFRVVKYGTDNDTGRKNIIDSKDICGHSLTEALKKNNLDGEEWTMTVKTPINQGFKYF